MSSKLTEAIQEMIKPMIAEQVTLQLPTLISHLRPDQALANEIERISAQAYLKKWEAALYLNVSETHIDNLIAEDPGFPVSRVGRNVRINRVELERYIRDKGRLKPKSVKSVTEKVS